jgi:anti-anti-sigma factor
MQVKFDTKEKFTVVTPIMPELSANIAAELAKSCIQLLQKDVKNVILNLEAVTVVEELAAESLAGLQQEFYENNASFVICSLQPPVEEAFEKMELLELLNITPTESEAWDIVQMEEIERDLLDGNDDVAFDQKFQ